MNRGETVGVLLMAYGSPDRLDDVEEYYTHIRGGRKPDANLVEGLRERYRLVGEQTPLLEISQNTARRLEIELNRNGGHEYRVFLGMKHWHPFIDQAVQEMIGAGIGRAVGLVLAPHYAGMSIGGYYRYLGEAQQRHGSSIQILSIESWHLHPPYLKAVEERVRTRLKEFGDAQVTVVFTAHSLPQKIVEAGDPYPTQLLETSEELASRLGLENWRFCYQSAGHTPDPWLGPDLPDVVRELGAAGVGNILVAPIGFVSDHLEILYDIDHEAQEAAKESGVTLLRTESLNDSPDFVSGLAILVEKRLKMEQESLTATS